MLLALICQPENVLIFRMSLQLLHINLPFFLTNHIKFQSGRGCIRFRPLPVPPMTGPLNMDCGLLRRILDLTLPVIWRFPTVVIVLGEHFKLMLIGPLHRDQDHLF